MRKPNTIQKEIDTLEKSSKSKALLDDEKKYVEGKLDSLRKELEDALNAEEKRIEKKSSKKPKAKKKKKRPQGRPKGKNSVEKVKKFIVFEGKKIYEDDKNYCDALVKAWEGRKSAVKKAAGTRKTKPVTQRVAANVASSVKKGIQSISKDELKKNPKAAIKKMERLEKAGKEYLAAYEDILGENITQKEIKAEFDGLDKLIKEIEKKYVTKGKKMAKGGETEETYIVLIKPEKGSDWEEETSYMDKATAISHAKKTSKDNYDVKITDENHTKNHWKKMAKGNKQRLNI